MHTHCDPLSLSISLMTVYISKFEPVLHSQNDWLQQITENRILVKPLLHLY